MASILLTKPMTARSRALSAPGKRFEEKAGPNVASTAVKNTNGWFWPLSLARLHHFADVLCCFVAPALSC